MSDSVLTGDTTLTALRAFTQALTSRALLPVGAEVATAGTVDRLARISALEDLRSVLAAVQAVEVAALTAERRAAVEHDIATVSRPGIGVARRREESARRTVADIARARRVSPWQASRFVAFAEQAPSDLPLTFHLLATGRLSERRAGLVLAAASPLPPEQRRLVDTAVAPGLAGWGDREVDRHARAAAHEVDPRGAVERHARAFDERRVTVRPAPECMAWVTTLCSMSDAVAVRAELERQASTLIAAGDSRTRGQLGADLLTGRVLGTVPGAPTPLAVQLVVTDATLTGGDAPAHLAGGEPVPAPVARAWVLGHPDEPADGVARTVRRLFTDPRGRLVAAETASREFTPAQAALIRLRDGVCTTPWCDAPIEHVDHHRPHADGGPTSVENGRGLCRSCNLAKGDQPPPALASDPPRRSGRSPVEHAARRRLRRRARRARARRTGVEIELPTHRGRTLRRPGPGATAGGPTVPHAVGVSSRDRLANTTPSVTTTPAASHPTTVSNGAVTPVPSK